MPVRGRVRPGAGDPEGHVDQAGTLAEVVPTSSAMGLAPPSASPRREACGKAAGVFGLALVEGVGDGQVAHDKCTGEEEAHRDEPHDTAPAAGNVCGGGVLDPGVGPLHRAAPRIGAPVGGRGVVVTLGRLGVDRGWDGDRLLDTARWQVRRRGEDLGVGEAKCHGSLPCRAAQLAQDRRAGDAVISVGVASARLAELVALKLG
ncbi:MAG: hypothetical protein ABSA14_11295 [Acidimicrobiales bacterium]